MRLHAVNVAKPPEASVTEQGGHAQYASMIEHFGVRDSVLPLDFEEVSEAAEVERVEALFLPGVSCPGLAPIQQGGENARLIDEGLGSLA